MLKSFFLTKEYAVYAWLMLAFLLSLIWYNVEILVYYNFWNKEIYDVIQSLQEERFWELFLGWDAGRFLNFVTLTEGTSLKPTFAKPAPVDLRHQIATECQVVIEALAD